MQTAAAQTLEPHEPGPHPSGGAAPEDRGAGDRHRLTVLGGLSALSLDAMASVAYGPEAVVLVLATAGGAGLGFTLPVTAAIAALLGVLVFSYRQVIAAFPDGGGAYAVAKARLGRRTSLVAAASLVIDYVLNVAVSVAAGVAALTAAFPALLPYTVELCLVVLALITGVNLRGVAHSARAFMLPTAVFVGSVVLVIVVGLFRDAPAAPPLEQAGTLRTVGVLLLLRAFASGCAALTGVEAIANAVPSFKAPRIRRAQHTELALGGILGVLLIGLAVLITKFDIRPVDGTTVLAQVTNAALGHGVGFYAVQVSTTVLLALAANTSFGGLPVLARLLAADHFLPHVFALRADRQVYRYGVVVLAVVSAVILVLAGGDMNTLVPLFAIGVFVGFTVAQTGMVRHWLAHRVPGWRWKVAVNAVGAALTAVATVVTLGAKFADGGWIIAVALPLLVVGFLRVHAAYARMGRRLGLGVIPAPPRGGTSLVVVPVHSVSALSKEALCAAMSLGDEVVAVRVVYPDEPADMVRFRAEWEAWHPDVTLALVDAPHRDLGRPLVDFLRAQRSGRRVFVLVAEIEPEHLWERVLRNQRGAVIDRAVRRDTDAIVCRMRYRLAPPEPAKAVPLQRT
ncbi:putative amino acid permease [Longispora fulva]|uniref:Amino acid transporter n=1 Tax=Longispora fulva TaxID=619741 RepID=A0A8J7GC66_9ACTN|nr:APC family permease [Longispora fulva]MBG6134891.1 amino acid transporter [Longispora fulva]GIG56878.1 putative amino acid permease [Longispora fulva]